MIRMITLRGKPKGRLPERTALRRDTNSAARTSRSLKLKRRNRTAATAFSQVFLVIRSDLSSLRTVDFQLGQTYNISVGNGQTGVDSCRCGFEPGGSWTKKTLSAFSSGFPPVDLKP